MTAWLLAATSSGLPVLLRHRIGTPLDERIAEIGDVDAFPFMELGAYWRPGRGRGKTRNPLK